MNAIATGAAEAIKIRNLVKRFGAFTAVKDVNISVPAGSFLVLVGPSGCGKSTLLRMLAGLESPSEGEIAFVGQTVSSGAGGVIADAGRRNAGLVFQSYALWPHMTVAGNIAWPLKVAKWPRDKREKRVREVLALLGIDALAERYPAEISGGQQQRVAIARTIAPEPSILLFDEPLSNLDAKLRIEMRSELMRIHRATGATSVYVTHDQVEAMTMATHVAVLNNGRVEQFGKPIDLLRDPQTTFVATFLGTPPANLIPVHRLDDRLHFGELALAPASLAAGHDAAQLLYRAEDVSVGSIAGAPSLTARFAEAAPIAGRTMVTAMVGDLRVTAMADGYFTATPGEALPLSFIRTPDAVFAATGERIHQ
ncbi:ABC transporter ATP-binding protein [Ensifer adhaerens]|uniref:ABC transporter ATP-binding protein n=1 Tax=Ensifer adhaerens TaxID=106592 RepID=UPI001CBB8F30|nr:ABC transporter ATP-binding protein [Ensifer adhaerens]MBZ7924515.1 ABC transporter ATP-binding protein [Ensifer adhaerens]UAX96245.1 ABC transporter ATP-binding protein [Ensifer adhaerens]UAY04412.1 ABC transporter ATP-binding protein [Ensifer adhaerens]UAY09844.1 ABC transporter ATP-binding protein [Ensifer adhaerens]